MSYKHYSKNHKQKVLKLRKSGYSIKQIATTLNIPQSTISLWVREIILSKQALAKIQERIIEGRKKAKQLRANKTQLEYKELSA